VGGTTGGAIQPVLKSPVWAGPPPPKPSPPGGGGLLVGLTLFYHARLHISALDPGRGRQAEKPSLLRYNVAPADLIRPKARCGRGGHHEASSVVPSCTLRPPWKQNILLTFPTTHRLNVRFHWGAAHPPRDIPAGIEHPCSSPDPRLTLLASEANPALPRLSVPHAPHNAQTRASMMRHKATLVCRDGQYADSGTGNQTCDYPTELPPPLIRILPATATWKPERGGAGRVTVPIPPMRGACKAKEPGAPGAGAPPCGNSKSNAPTCTL